MSLTAPFIGLFAHRTTHGHGQMSAFTIRHAGLVRPDDKSTRTLARTVLYTHTLCPYAERVWIALLEKQVQFDLIHIDLSSKPDWYRSINPRGLVPAVLHDATTHVESLDICRWADACLSGPPLAPMRNTDRDAHMNALIAAGSDLVTAGLSLLSGTTGRYWGIGKRPSDQQCREFETQLHRAIIEPLKTFGGPYLLGDSLTLADITVYPFLSRFALAAKHFSNFDISQVNDGGELLVAWLKEMHGRPSCAITTPNEECLLKAFHEHMSLDFFDYHSYAACELHPHNKIYLIEN